MRAVLVLMIAALILAGCVAAPPEATPAPSTTQAPTEPPAPTLTPTPASVIDRSVWDALGAEQAAAIEASIGNKNEISVINYEAGSAAGPYAAYIDLESIEVTHTADWYFTDIVTATARDRKNNHLDKVVWNPDSSTWVKATQINPDLTISSSNSFTSFKSIEGMVVSGALHLV